MREVALYRDGLTGQEIARMLDIPESTVYYRLRASGVRMRPRGLRRGMGSRLDHDEMERTIALYRAGYSVTEVAEMLGVYPASVTYRLKHAGVPRRTRGESMKLRWARRPKKRFAQTN